MESNALILAILMLTPIGLMLAVFKGRSRLIMAFLTAGIFMALFAGEINGYIRSVSGLTTEFMTVNITPITEEILKALPVVMLAFLIKPERQLLLECSISIGVGFALLENVFIFSQMAGVSVLWAFTRGFGAGLMHALSTAAVGYAMSYIIEKHKIFFSGSFAALSLAIIYHSVFNIIVSSDYSFLGVMLPIITYIPIFIILKKLKKGVQKK